MCIVYLLEIKITTTTCVSMAGRAFLAGYPRNYVRHWFHKRYHDIPLSFSNRLLLSITSISLRWLLYDNSASYSIMNRNSMDIDSSKRSAGEIFDVISLVQMMHWLSLYIRWVYMIITTSVEFTTPSDWKELKHCMNHHLFYSRWHLTKIWLHE